MPAAVTIDFFPKPAIIASQFYQLAGDVDVRSLREPLKRSIQQVIAPAFRENFDTSGPGWVPLADITAKKKAHKGYPNDPLIATGKLRRKAGQLNIWTIDGPRGEARLDNLGDAYYGGVHQMGSEFIPQREWAMLTPDEIDKVEQVFGRWIDERIAIRLRIKAM